MARPIVGGTRENIVKQKRANGIVYVIKRTVNYDPETRRNKVLKTEIIGKLDADGNVVPTRFKAPSVKPGLASKEKTSGGQNASGSNSVAADSGSNNPEGRTRRFHYGMMSLLEWAGKASGIDDDLKKAMPEHESGSLAERIISIARFWIATGGDTLPNMYAWQIKHGIEEENMISEDLCRKVFDLMGIHEDYLQTFFQRRAARVGNGDEGIAYDSSTVSTYSGQLRQARYGFNKDGDKLPTIKLITFYSLNNDQPIAFYTQPGNLPDVTCVENAIKHLNFLNMKGPLFVTDNGFYSQENIVRYTKASIKYQTRVTVKGGQWIKNAGDQNIDKIGTNNIISFDRDVSGITVVVKPELSYQAKYDTPSQKKGDIIKLKPRIYLSILRSDTKYGEDKRLLIEKICSLKQVIEDGRENEFSETELKTAKHFLTWSHKRNGKITASIKDDVFKQHEKYFGVFCYASNKVKDPASALKFGRKREHIEDMFELFKQKAEGSKPRVHDDDRFRGRLFVQFIALCYLDFFYKRIGDMKKTLGKPNGDARHDLKENLDDERTLLNWLINVSLHDILQWFDAVDLITFVGKRHNRISAVTETTKRDRLFLQKLGYYGGMMPN